MQIIIADNNEDSRMILKETLESTGYRVKEASNGAEAINIAKNAA